MEGNFSNRVRDVIWQIEGTQSSLSDLLLFELDEAPGVALDDVREVSRYVAALEHGIRRISDGFPISNRLIRELHEILLEGGRGAASQPGEFRRSQVWIGGTHPGNASFVPPPAARVPDCMARLEAFIHADHGQGALVKAALAHAQFETIHPFLDGNGRVGRLLISLILVTEGILSQPLLYLSLYFKKHRDRYYELLQATRIEGDWEGWVQFFADGVLETAGAAVTLARDLDQLFQRDRNSLVELRNQGSLLQVLLAFQRHPVRTIRQIAEETGLSVPTVGTAIGTLEGRGLVRETTGKRRGRVYAYDEYLRLLVEGT